MNPGGGVALSSSSVSDWMVSPTIPTCSMTASRSSLPLKSPTARPITRTHSSSSATAASASAASSPASSRLRAAGSSWHATSSRTFTSWSSCPDENTPLRSASLAASICDTTLGADQSPASFVLAQISTSRESRRLPAMATALEGAVSVCGGCRQCTWALCYNWEELLVCAGGSCSSVLKKLLGWPPGSGVSRNVPQLERSNLLGQKNI
mmetsp:Transcript_130/g.305  ORF Transcript_130/g.305 Transcript_130/m.305 type:complete len:209 (-) Transcript_130:132-758(-)